MKEKVCYIVGAGKNYGLDFSPHSGDLVIAADAGLNYLEQSDISADLVIGDFDTLKYKPDHPDVITLDEEKDDTDMLAAVRQGIDKGHSVFHIYGGMGGRFDHTIANLQVLAYLSKQNKKGLLFGKNCIITAITNKSIWFSSKTKGIISVFSLTDISSEVYIRGLKYELDNATLKNTFPIGVSNEFIGKESTITVKDGTLLVVFPRE